MISKEGSWAGPRLASYSNTAAMMTTQRIAPIASWEGASKMLEQWLVLLCVILGPPEMHLAVHELSILVNIIEEVSACLCTQSYQHIDMLSSPIHIVHTKFNESFRKVFMRPLSVLWPHFVPLVRTLTMGHFR